MGWFGDAFIVLGLWRMGDQRRDAFILQSIGNLAWASVAIASRDWALVALCVVLISLSIRGYIRWGSK